MKKNYIAPDTTIYYIIINATLLTVSVVGSTHSLSLDSESYADENEESRVKDDIYSIWDNDWSK